MVDDPPAVPSSSAVSSHVSDMFSDVVFPVDPQVRRVLHWAQHNGNAHYADK